MGKKERKKKEEWKKDEKPMFGRRKYVEKSFNLFEKAFSR